MQIVLISVEVFDVFMRPSLSTINGQLIRATYCLKSHNYDLFNERTESVITITSKPNFIT